MAESHVIYKAEVQVGIKDKGFKAEAKKISDKVKSLGRDLNIKPGTVAPTKEMKALQAETRKAQQELDRLQKKQESLRKAHQNSPEYKALTKDIQKAEQEIDGMIAKQSAWAEMGLVGNSQFNALDDQIEQARVRLEGLYEKQRAIAESGATDKEAQEWYEVGDSVERARTRVQGLYAEQEKMKSSGSAYERAKQAATGVSGAAKKAKKEAAGAANAFRKFGGAVKGASSKLLKFITHGNGAAKALTSMKKGLLTGAGLKPLAKLAAIGGGVWLAVRGISEGMKNLVQYSGETNNSVSMLWGSLIQLKNALATAFAPIFNAAAPALNALIQLVTKAATAIAHFTAAFTGKSTVVVAKQQTADYAASLGDAADAAGSANDAAKEYQKTLLGFDQMNVLNNTDNSSGSGGSGGGGGAGGVGDMFETVEVSSGAKSLVNRIKEAWKNADFTDLGRDLGNKIAEELNKIPWEKLQNIAYKLGKSIATGFNGLNDSEFWGSLGHAVAESLNTVLTGIEGFVFNFKWTKAGRALADGINHLFLDFDWKKLGRTFSEGAKGILDALKGLFDDIEWEEVGKSVMSAITNVDWVGIITKGIQAAGSLATGILNFIKGAFAQAAEDVSEWISSGEMWKDIKNLGKVTFDVGINLVGAAWTTIETALNGIWNIVASIGEKLGITRSFGSGAVSAVSEDGGIKGRTIKSIIPSVFKEISNTPAFSWTKGIGEVIQLIPGMKKLFENDGVSFSKEFGDIWRDIKDTFSGFDKKVQKAGKEGKLNASVIGAFGKNPFDKGALFGSLSGLSAQAKIKTTAELVGIKDKIPNSKKSVGNMIAQLTKKNETFSKTTGNMTAALGSKFEGFSHSTNNMTASLGSKLESFSHATNNMTASLGSKLEGFDHWSNPMSAWLKNKGEYFDHWTNPMSAWLKNKGEYFDHWTNAMTAYITSISLGSRARQIVLNAYTRQATGGLYRNGRWQPITAAANGGSFNTGQMFIAREAGPELVGRIGSGTSVMNNDQIVASVSAGVAKGAYEAFVSAFRDTGGNSPQVVLEGDAAKMFRVVQRQAVQYMNSTGQAPFPV